MEEVVSENVGNSSDVQEKKPEKASAGRLEYIDVLRGFAVILVIVGHCAPPTLDTYIFSFHMPLFFFISGVLFAFKERQDNFLIFLKKKFLRLIVPYFAFEAINLLISFIVSRFYSGVTVSFPSAILQILTALPAFVNGYSGVAGRLWFFPCLFFAEIVFYFIYALISFLASKFKRKQLFKTIAFLIISAGAYCASYFQNKLFSTWWLYTDTAIMGVCFLALGCALKVVLDKFMCAKLYIKIPAALIFLAGLIFFTYLNYFKLTNYVDVFMSLNSYGSYIAFAPSAVCGIAFSCALVSIFSQLYNSAFFRGIKLIGTNSLGIYAVHVWYMFIFKTLLLDPLYVNIGDWWRYAAPWIEFVLITACTLPTVWAIKKIAPEILGEPRKKVRRENQVE